MALNMNLLTAKFAAEAAKHCDQLEKELLMLEKDGFSRETLNSVFRSAHTIKGAARMLKLTTIAEVAHRIEDVLEQLRNGQMHPSGEVVDRLLKGADATRELIVAVAMDRPLPDTLPPICSELETMIKNEPASNPHDPEQKLSLPVHEGNSPSPQGASPPPHDHFVQIRAEQLDELVQLMGEMISFQYRKKQQLSRLQDATRLSAASLTLVTAQAEQEHPELAELLTALHRELMKMQKSLNNNAVVETLLTADLQEQSLKMRMLPLSTIFTKINRAVRDLTRTTGKEIEFQVAGGNTELDRKIIEQLGDCLLHMVRNAVDHGIELPNDRVLAGKAARGSIRLSAYYNSGGVTIILEDDGAGIDLAAIKATAVKKNLLTETAVNKLTDTELLDLLFVPGFSTSPIITDISGRGVGMNIVRQTITETLKGSVSIRTKPGKGTTFHLNVPITLALSRLLLIAAGSHTFALPAYTVQEIILLPAGEVIQVIHKRALRIREQIVPLEGLGTILACPESEPQERTEYLIILLSSGAEKLGLIVDAVINEADMVIKPLPSSLQHLGLLSGFTIGSNDEVISVLTASALIKQARETNSAVNSLLETAPQKHSKTILVVDDSANTREIVQNILESYGYQVDLAENGQAAIEKTGRKVYDAVVTDVEMPGLDGFSLTLQLRQDERYRQIPIIIVTSRETPADKRRGIQVGASAYIVKGAFDQNNLIETLQNLIG